VLKWEPLLDGVRDGRKRAQVPTWRVVRALAAMMLCRLGSLNALAQSSRSRFWRGWLRGDLPSADTLGRVAGLMDAAGVRALLRGLYERLKRGKALSPPWHGLMAATLDGHESHATFRRCCAGCLKRTLRTSDGDRVQYYHRYVALGLVAEGIHLWLDAEEQRPGQDEVGAALRLLERALEQYPRAFDVVVADGLYADPRVFNLLLARGKDVVATLKANQPALLEDALSLTGAIGPTQMERDGHSRSSPRATSRGWQVQCWDIEGFTSWASVEGPLRVVRSLESRTVRRQMDGEQQDQRRDWLWVTTLKPARASSRALIELGHARWQIENQGFNEMVNQWHADHVYRHHGTAILAMWLLAMICLNVFLAFYRRNLKPAARAAATMLHIAREIAAELYSSIPEPRSRAPT